MNGAIQPDLADLTDLSHDSLLLRDSDDRITYWNKASETLYGWPQHHAIGKLAHELLGTQYPAPLESIEAQLHATGHWQATALI